MTPNEKIIESLSNQEAALLIKTRAQLFFVCVAEKNRALSNRYLNDLKEMISFYESNF